ncbi:flavodoxin family protein [Marinobacterium arenosum]|uniref:flavodoxin family protein n=1 Tax=Marinobacterium arenosum TaxID=2862496 RepID=UPI001C93C18B|nr:flavodoxin family protein [Marinobacterium arenosum]MBY4678102.1 flavodoxin family protein [Marinobacterium arenosum]
MIQVAIAYHSGFGHTEVLAQAVAAGVEQAGAAARLVPVAELAQVDWCTLKAADAIIFGSPTYMGNVSGPFKCFMDASVRIWGEQGWQDKLAAGFTNSASQNGDKLNTLIAMALFAAQHGMHWVSLGLLPGNNSSTGSDEDLNRLGSSLGAMAQSNADQDPALTPPQADRCTARRLGERVALAAGRWRRGVEQATL